MAFVTKPNVYIIAEATARLALAANPARRYLAIENRGQGLVSFKLGSQFSPAETEVQKITFPAVPAGGSWSLLYSGQETAELAYNANAAAIQTALRALSTIGAGNVNVAGDYAVGFTITFAGSKAGTAIEPITININGLLSGRQNTIQRVLFNAAADGGTFTLGGSAAMAFDISAANMKTALNAIVGKEGWVSTVTKNAAGDYAIEFGGEGYAYIEQELLTSTSSLTDSSAQATEAGVLYAIPEPVVGTYKLWAGDQVTIPLAYDANAATIQAALEALSTVGAGNVTVTGSDLTSGFTVTYQGALADTAVPDIFAENIDTSPEDLGEAARAKTAYLMRFDFKITQQGAGVGSVGLAVTETQAAFDQAHVEPVFVTLTQGHIQPMEGGDIQPTEKREFADGQAPIDSVWVLATENTEIVLVEGE